MEDKKIEELRETLENAVEEVEKDIEEKVDVAEDKIEEVKEKRSSVRKMPKKGEAPADAIEIDPEVKEKLDNALKEVGKTVESAKEKVSAKAAEVKANLAGEDGKFDKEDIKRVSGEVKESAEKKAGELKEAVLGDDGKFDKDDLRRLGNAFLEVGASLAGLGESGFHWVKKSLRSAKKDVAKRD